MDRTVATGTGNIGQYLAPLAATYESIATFPDDLLLFMHHVRYTYRLHFGLTVMQCIDNTHCCGRIRLRSNCRRGSPRAGWSPTRSRDEVFPHAYSFADGMIAAGGRLQGTGWISTRGSRQSSLTNARTFRFAAWWMGRCTHGSRSRRLAG